MKKNSYKTHLLIFLFLFSTTGMPVVLHHCNTMQVTSFTACEMHSVKEEEKSCCVEEEPADVFYSALNDVCCSEYLVDESIKEIFITGTKDIQILQTAANFHPDLNNIPFIQSEIISFYLFTQAPPGKIYLKNSVLLI